MQPVRLPKRSATLRSSLAYAFLSRRTRILCIVSFSPTRPAACRSLHAARRRGSPGLRGPVSTRRTFGASPVSGSSPVTVPQSATPPTPFSARPIASKKCCFPGPQTLEHRHNRDFGAEPCGPLTRLTTLQSLPHDNDCKPDFQPVGYTLVGWDSNPQDDISKFQVTSTPSPRTGLAGSLLYVHVHVHVYVYFTL
jgi:hypothetical protein